MRDPELMLSLLREMAARDNCVFQRCRPPIPNHAVHPGGTEVHSGTGAWELRDRVRGGPVEDDGPPRTRTSGAGSLGAPPDPPVDVADGAGFWTHASIYG